MYMGIRLLGCTSLLQKLGEHCVVRLYLTFCEVYFRRHTNIDLQIASLLDSLQCLTALSLHQ